MVTRSNVLVITAGLLVSGCLRPAEERALSDLEVGFAESAGVAVASPSAHVRTLATERLDLWANHPVVEVEVRASAAGPLAVVIDNCMPDAVAEVVDGGAIAVPVPSTRSTRCAFDLDLPAGLSRIRVAPVDWDEASRFRFAVMGDIQTGLDRVGEVFTAIADHPGVRFVVSTGDLVEDAREDEYEELLGKLGELPVPYYSTIGNHELRDDPERWSRRFGRFNVHFVFKSVAFSFVDSASASLDPVVYDWLDEWIDDAEDGVHVYGQHFPAIDPVGQRQASMRSRKEAAMLLSRLAAGGVDVTFYGHLHSYYAFENAGIPAYISGGGGALPERWDGIGRHFLSVDVDPVRGIEQVAVVRVD